jgi:hypothetical protein
MHEPAGWMTVMSNRTPKIARLKSLRGRIAPTSTERLLLGIYGAITTVTCVAFFLLAVRKSGQSGTTLALELISATCFGVLAAIILRRCIVTTYELDHGILRCRGLRGRVLWEESLEGIVEMTRVWGTHGPGHIRIKWPSRTRVVPFDEWWLEAIALDDPKPRWTLPRSR